MPGSIYSQVGEWNKVLILFPTKINEEWHFLKFAYKREINHSYYDGVETEKQFKTEKQFLLDELRNKND